MSKTPFLLIALLLCLQQLPAQIDFGKGAQRHPQLADMDRAIEAGTYERITSVLVAQHGKLLHEAYFNGADESSLHNTRSATKTIATLLTGIAIDRGHIASEKDPILKYLQHKLPLQHPDPRKETMRIEDLLTMSSLMECSDDDQFSRGNENRMYLIEDWTQFFLDLPIRAFPFGPGPSEQPYGRAFSYCTAGSATMAEVVESAVGMPAHQFAQQHLLAPLGITDYKFHFTPMGILNTAGGSEYRSRDFLKLIQMCLQGGQWKGQQIISKAWLDKATSPKAQAWEGMEYGYLFWLKAFGEDRTAPGFSMAGNGGQKVLAVPSLDLAVVITTTNYNNRKAHGYTDELMEKYIVPAFAGK